MKILQLLLDMFYEEPQIYQEYDDSEQRLTLKQIFKKLGIKSTHRQWLFQKILFKIKAFERIDIIDVDFIIHEMNQYSEMLIKRSWPKESFDFLENELVNIAEPLVKNLESANEIMEKEINLKFLNFKKIYLN